MTTSGKRRGEATREVILAAAEVVFAQHGFDGARIDVIADASGYNKNLIFRYFGDKFGLYAQVLKRADREMGEILAHVFAPLLEDETTILEAQKFRTFLKMMLQTLFDYLFEHPHLMRMLTWEMAEGWQAFAQVASQFPNEDVDRFEQIFHKAQDAGLFRSNFVPIIQFATILQICMTYLASLPMYQILLPQEELSSVESRARARDYFVDFVTAGMMADPAETKPEKGI
jgi:TetR/AcrR family transcriptional regulator